MFINLRDQEQKILIDTTSFCFGQVPKWPTGADCKSADLVFGGSNPSLPTPAGVAQLVEHQPSKLNVASSSLVSRSIVFNGRLSSGVEHFHGKEGGLGSNPRGGSALTN